MNAEKNLLGCCQNAPVIRWENCAYRKKNGESVLEKSNFGIFHRYFCGLISSIHASFHDTWRGLFLWKINGLRNLTGVETTGKKVFGANQVDATELSLTKNEMDLFGWRMVWGEGEVFDELWMKKKDWELLTLGMVDNRGFHLS